MEPVTPTRGELEHRVRVALEQHPDQPVVDTVADAIHPLIQAMARRQEALYVETGALRATIRALEQRPYARLGRMFTRGSRPTPS